MADQMLDVDAPFRLMVQSIVDYAILTLDAEGRVASWNAGAERIKKFQADEILGRHFSIFYPAEDVAAGKPARELSVARETGRFEDEGWRLRKDGSWFWANVIITALRDDAGDLRGFIKLTRDLTERLLAEEAAQRGRETFRRVIEAAPNAIVAIDRQGRIVMVNAQTERVFGYDRAELLGKAVEILVPERFRQGHPALRSTFFDKPQSRPMGAGRDLYGLRKDGSEFPVEIGLNPIETDEGTLVLSSIIDISLRKRLEERFRRVVEAAPSAMVMINDVGRIEMVNTQAERVFGYDRTELLGQPIEMLVPTRFRNGHSGLRDAFLTAPQSRPMGAGRDLYGLRKDGSEFPVEIGLNPIETDEGPMVLSAIVDISSRKRLEERFRRVVEAAPSAMVMINRSGLIEMVNTQAERVFGYDRAELLGQPIEILVPERFRHGHSGLRGAFFAAPQSRPMGAGRDLYGLRQDGSEFPVEIGLNPIETDEGPMVLSAIVDISDRKQKEDRIQAALEEKSILLAEIHHRVKNNLQIVHSLLDLQSARLTDPGAIEMLKESKNRVSSMALIHQILYQSENFAEVDFSAVLDSLVPILMQSYSTSSSAIAVSIEADNVMLPLNAAIPCGLIINELAANALKHAFPGQRSGTFSIRLKNEPAEMVFLEVVDDGIGISAEIDMAEASTLGLQLVHMLTSQLGGELKIHHAHPTSFAIRFPRSRSRDNFKDR
jgi:PAS domain S-box-containing protein